MKIGNNSLIESYSKNLNLNPKVKSNNNKFIIVWREIDNNESRLFYEMYSEEGKKLNNKTKVNEPIDENSIINDFDIQITNDGKFFISWFNINTVEVYGQFIDSLGNKISRNFLINSNENEIETEIGANDKIAVTWKYYANDDVNIYARIILSNGKYYSEIIKVNDDDSSYNLYPSISIDKKRNFAIYWTCGTNLIVQLFNKEGEKIKNNFILNNNSYNPKLILKDRKIFTVWQNAKYYSDFYFTDFNIMAEVFELENPITENENNLLLPKELYLGQNFPNPFNPTTRIQYSIPLNEGNERKVVRIIVYDFLGREVRMIVNKEQTTGNYEVCFDGCELASGVYYYQMKVGDFIQTKKMVLLK